MSWSNSVVFIVVKHNAPRLFSEEVCNNVHAQSRRMVMVSPEPNFWIHAVSYAELNKLYSDQ